MQVPAVKLPQIYELLKLLGPTLILPNFLNGLVSRKGLHTIVQPRD